MGLWCARLIEGGEAGLLFGVTLDVVTSTVLGKLWLLWSYQSAGSVEHTLFPCATFLPRFNPLPYSHQLAEKQAVVLCRAATSFPSRMCSVTPSYHEGKGLYAEGLTLFSSKLALAGKLTTGNFFGHDHVGYSGAIRVE